MRAVVVTEPGAPPHAGDRPDPGGGAGRALVAVTAAPVTPLDVLCASGVSYFGRPVTPYVPGVQGVGAVVASERWAAGTRVWFETKAGMAPGDGGMAELCAVPEGDVVPLPDAVDDALAAALGLSAVAAWRTLTATARLRAGEVVLVLGGGGVVGQVAIQAARLLGAGRVVAACRSAAAQERARAAGADVVVALDGEDDVPALAARFLAACGELADVVVDPLCGTPASAAGLVLADGGRLVNLGSSAGPAATFDSATLRSRSAAILGYTNNALTTEQRDEALSRILTHAADGAIRVGYEDVPLHDVEGAWRRQAAGATAGRLVIRPRSGGTAGQ